MPLDGHAYLVSQGWSGKGNGLRQGAIARPIAITQKKTLAGVGKDRDDAFPFWDHVFEQAAISIRIQTNDSDDDSNSESASTPLVLQRTSTGIISHRRPTTGTPALSGNVTPDSHSSTPTRMSLMASARQQAARKMLYSMFFRGPVIGGLDEEQLAEGSVETLELVETIVEQRDEKNERKKRKRDGKETEDGVKRKKRSSKREAVKSNINRGGEDVIDIVQEDQEDVEELTTKGNKSQRDQARELDEAQNQDTHRAEAKEDKAERKRLRDERRAQREERRKRKAERKQARGCEIAGVEDVVDASAEHASGHKDIVCRQPEVDVHTLQGKRECGEHIKRKKRRKD